MKTDNAASSTPVLSNGKLLLRPWRPCDVDALYEAACESISTVGRWLPWCHAGYSRADAVEWIAHCQSGWHDGEHFAFPIFDATSGELLGGAGLNQRNRIHRSASLGYWVRQTRQRQGIACAAARLVAQFGFDQLALVRIGIAVLPDNTASRHTALKIGAQFEAISRQRLCIGEQAHDAAVYGLVRSDLLRSLRNDC